MCGESSSSSASSTTAEAKRNDSDGVFGVMSVKAEQTRLKRLGYYDGVIDGARGPMTKKALQRALNDKRL